MGSCGNSTIVDDASDGSVMKRHLCSGMLMQFVSEEPSGSELACDRLELNVDQSNKPDGCLHFAGEGCGSASVIDVTGMAGDPAVSECENADLLVWGKTLENDSESCLEGGCGQKNAIHAGCGGLSSEEKPQHGDGREMQPEFLSLNDFSEDCVQQVEQNDEKSSIFPSFPSEGESAAVVEDKNDSAGLLTDASNNISAAFDHTEMSLQSKHMTDLLVHCRPQDEVENIIRIADPILEVVDKCDALCGEVDACKQITLAQGSEVPSNLLYIGNKSDDPHDHEDSTGCNSAFEEREREKNFVDKESIIDTSIQILSPQGCMGSPGSSPIADIPHKATQLEQEIDNSDTEPHAEDVAIALEPNKDAINEIVVETKNHVLPLEANTCELKDDSLQTTNSKPFFSESDWPSVSFTSNNSSNDTADLFAKYEHGSIGTTSTQGNSGQTDNDGKDVVKVDCVAKGKCLNIGSLPSQRNSGRRKSSRKTQNQRASRKSKNKVCVLHPVECMNRISEAARKKRSCLSKPARSSIWGNINGFFEQGTELGVNEVICQQLVKARGSCQDGKENKNGASSSSLSAMQNQCSHTPRVRLKIKIGKRFDLSSSSVISKVVDGPTSASYLGAVSDTQTVASIVRDELPEDIADGKYESFKKNLDSDALVLNGQITNSHFDSTVMTEKSDGDVEEFSVVVPPEAVVEALQEPDTSPDSEVINSIEERQPEGVRNNSVGSFRESTTVHVSSKRGKKKDKLTRSTNCIVEDESQDSSGTNNAKHSKSYGHQKKISDAIFFGESITSSIDVNASSNSTSSKELSAEPMPHSGGTEHGASTEALTVKSSMEAKTTCSPPVDDGFSGPQSSENLLPSAQSSGRKLPQSLKSTKVSKLKSNSSDLVSSKKAASRQRGKQRKPVNKSKDKANGVSDQVVCEIAYQQHTENGCDGNHELNAIGKINAGEDGASVDASKLDSVGFGKPRLLPRNAWVRCDDCHKWRRISAELADKIEESNCTWTCLDSNDKAFADCSIPQEKSNAEINAELGLSDEEDAYEDCKNYKELYYRRPTVSQQSTFTRISTNEFLHRSRTTQTIDEIMVCHCKPPPHGQLGCGDECLNRMLNIECVQGTCPCGDFCSNQQFQKRNYARLKWFKCGKKGYGLKAVEGISKGQFLIEYVGEVLDMPTYEARQREYALKGHRHFYFMTLNGSEVIDASAKGNFGRFINHSCDPNCRTEKWIVNGEICIGLFALRDIKQDEEVTFDYNYVRVFGAAAKKCYCGSPQCRGYIGGDPLNSEVIVQGDSDEEFPEPVMLTEDGETEDSMSRANYFNNVHMLSVRHILKNRDRLDKSTNDAIVQQGISERESSMNHASADSELHSSLEGEDAKGRLPAYVKHEAFSQQMEDVTSLPWSSVQQEFTVDTELVDKTSSIERLDTFSTTSVSKVLSDGVDSNRELKSDVGEDRHVSSQPRLLVKKSRVKGSVKRGKVRANPPSDLKAEVTVNKLQVPSTKLKKEVQGSSNGRFEAVQEKLNELLDGDGGISKRKDATKGYLKLLLLTAATGDRINGEGIQSNRDLSMILEALLKTKSRAVLNDIINKNGLRMLHNMMKQYGRDFKKIPILRKLLKVLEYLAASKILGSEHINGGPPCHGMESFRESMLSLTEHDDKTVHQIARSFRDRWIRRPPRKFGYMERDDNRVKVGYTDRDDNRVDTHGVVNCGRFSSAHSHRHEQDVRSTEAIDCVRQSMPVTTVADTGAHEDCSAPSLAGCETNGPKRRKRKSRWDQPAETIPDSVLYPHKEQKMESSQNISEDVPPGFGCPFQNCGHPGYPSDAVVGQPKGKFNSLLPISYGMPLSFVQQYGTPHAEIAESWITAPGMPFSPFPPLPPHPREKKDRQPSNATDAMTSGRHAEEGQCGTGGSCMEDMIPSTTNTNPKDRDFQPDDSEHTSKRAKGLSHDLGKKYFRQHKWNNAKSPTWLRTRDFWGCSGSNSRVGMCSIGVVNVPDESNGAGHQEDAI